MRYLLPALLLFSASTFAVSVTSTVAHAQQPPRRGGGGGINGPCREDAARLCKGVEPGQGRLIACLQGSGEKVSLACKNQIQQMQARRALRKQQRPAAPAPAPAPTPAPAPAK